jgi:hypothetical protein
MSPRAKRNSRMDHGSSVLISLIISVNCPTFPTCLLVLANSRVTGTPVRSRETYPHVEINIPHNLSKR